MCVCMSVRMLGMSKATCSLCTEKGNYASDMREAETRAHEPESVVLCAGHQRRHIWLMGFAGARAYNFRMCAKRIRVFRFVRLCVCVFLLFVCNSYVPVTVRIITRRALSSETNNLTLFVYNIFFNAVFL